MKSAIIPIALRLERLASNGSTRLTGGYDVNADGDAAAPTWKSLEGPEMLPPNTSRNPFLLNRSEFRYRLPQPLSLLSSAIQLR
jgi:hypothetical protein